MEFFWINREQNNFEWFVKLLSKLEIEQVENQGGAMDRFLNLHMYITSALKKSDMKAVGLQMALDLLYAKVLFVHFYSSAGFILLIICVNRRNAIC